MLAILQQLCPGEKQHLIVGNLKDAVAVDTAANACCPARLMPAGTALAFKYRSLVRENHDRNAGKAS
jgi:hypothetical protein